MTDSREQHISHRELTLLALRCQHCQAELRIDWLNPKQRERLLDQQTLPPRCALCEAPFPTDVLLAFRGFREWWDRLQAARQEIIFCIPDPSEPKALPAKRTQ